jgi:hypothetical protein
MVKSQGHVKVKVGCQRNPYFLNSCYQINSKLGVKVAYGLPLSGLIFGPIALAAGRNLLTPKVKF